MIKLWRYVLGQIRFWRRLFMFWRSYKISFKLWQFHFYLFKPAFILASKSEEGDSRFSFGLEVGVDFKWYLGNPNIANGQ
jgi:hypothetical protein